MSNPEDKIEDLIKNAMKENLSQNSSSWPFLDIDDYRKKTGKRFRMTRTQMEQGITREQAFQQFMESMVSK